jgi:hypothetical protein
LKQLQLIQILSINAGGPLEAGETRAKVPRINRDWNTPNAAKAVSGNAETALKHSKQGNLGAWRFTAR